MRPPILPLSSFLSIIHTYYPFIVVEEASYKELPSYDDRNYYFRGKCRSVRHDTNAATALTSCQRVYITSHDEFVFKVINHNESTTLSVLNGLSEILKYLGSRGYNCPFPIASDNGLDVIPVHKSVYHSYANDHPVNPILVTEEGHYSFRLLTFIPGEVLSNIVDKLPLLFKFGQYLGSMDNELQNFSHVGLSSRKLFDWNLLYLLSMQDKATSVFKESKSKLSKIQNILSQFKETVVPVIKDLRQSIIHNDANSTNVVIYRARGEYEINGMIDFSDCIKAPIVFNLGIAMTHNMMETDYPATHIIPFLTGYESVFPLCDQERYILYYVILGRLAQLCINGECALLQDPTNEHLQDLIRSSWKLLDNLIQIRKEHCDDLWRN